MRPVLAALLLVGCHPSKDDSPHDTGGPPDSGDADPACPSLQLSMEGVALVGRLNEAAVTVLTLTNGCEGHQALTVSALNFTTNNAALQAIEPRVPYELAPGASRNVWFEFFPRDYSSATGTLTVESDDPDRPSVDIPVVAQVNADQDADGYAAIAAGGDDCDDFNALAHPGAVEIWYNGSDEDCAGGDDYDQDGDGYPRGIESGLDCDDASAEIHPDADEIYYDGIDENCDHASDFDQDGDGLEVDEDCDDTDPSLTVGTEEIWYDGIDQDCDGWDDFDADYDGYSSAAYGGPDCDDTDDSWHPGAAETWYDGLDQDCAGDDDYDADSDGERPPEWGGEDCDDTDRSVSSEGTELEDLADNDCDGLVDEDFVIEGDVLITELMVNPAAVGDTKGEYIELFNNSLNTIDLVGWTLSDGDGNTITVDSALPFAPGGYLVLGPNTDTATNGGVDVDFGYGTGLAMDNGSEETLRLELDGALIASVTYDEGWPVDSGAAVGLDPSVTDISATDSVDAWCAQETAMPSGDYGTPGEANDLCPSFDHDSDGWTGEDGDCDDADDTVNPWADEVYYDGVDQDCSGDSDYDYDADGYDADTYGGADCDDTDATISPEAPEYWYDGFDQDCSGGSDFDADGDGWDAEEGGGADCDDSSPEAWPGAEEIFYDGVDEDCLGGSDYDADGDGDDSDAFGGGDCDDSDASLSSLAEDAWDGLDGDCDGALDDAVIDDVALTMLTGPTGAQLGAPSGLSVSDLDGDGAGDLVIGSVAASSGAGEVWLLSGADLLDSSGAVDDVALASFLFSGTGGHGVLGPVQGDLSGDGSPDLTVAGSDTAGGAAIYIWPGGSLSGEYSAGSAWATLYGASGAPVSVVSHLDLDGTGVADLAFGDPTYTTTDKGQAMVVLDDRLASGGALSMSTAYDLRVRATVADACLGSALGGGDLDGDGYDDLIIGSYGATAGNGALYLYAGSSALSGAVDAPSGASLTVNGSASAQLGYSAPAVGDVDGDGELDLLMGAPGKRKAAIVLGVGGESGSLSFGSSDVVLSSAGDAAAFGVALALADVDGDGRDEALVGAPNTLTAGGGGTTYAGEAWLFWIDGAGTYSTTAAGGRLEGANAGDAFGGSLLQLGDLGGDGHDDLVFAAWDEDSGGTNAGAVYSVVVP